MHREVCVANLISSRKEEAGNRTKAEAITAPDDRVAELTTATQIIEPAIDQARSVGVRPP
jgi:hypothetical protein